MSDVMIAWVADGKGGVQLANAPVPVQASNQALVRCYATTLARGEVRHLPLLPEGRILGLDVAGVVEKMAPDGSGPAVGTRVIAMTGYSGGGWGQYAAVPSGSLGIIPDELTWAQAGLLPNSGLTALYAVRQGDSLLGKRVLVTGVTGAVGGLAAQLARLSGAHVTGTVRTPERAGVVAALGLDSVVVTTEASGPYDLVVETIGGEVLSQALRVVDSDGVVVTVGGGEGFDQPAEAAVVPHGWFFSSPGARLVTENVGVRVMRGVGVARDLGVLAELVASNKLSLGSPRIASWRDMSTLLSHTVSGGAREVVAFLIDQPNQ